MTLFDPPATPEPERDRRPGTGGRDEASYRIVVAYDGTDFRGFAAQSAAVRTVGGVLADAVAQVVRRDVDLVCAGRTDAGVHASGQVVSFAAESGLDTERIVGHVNSMLAPEIVVRSCDEMPGGFDARHSARWRHYRYTIVNRPEPDPFRDRFTWWVAKPLDLRVLRLASDPFVGEHDFSSFCRQGPAGSTTSRRVLESSWVDEGEGVLRYEIRAGAFCWQMVRSIVGTLVEVGAGKRTPGDVLAIMRAGDRAAAGQLAPPRGLCLWEVGY